MVKFNDILVCDKIVMKKYFFVLLLTSGFFNIPAKADILDDISALFKTGNATEISKYLAPSVEIGVLSDQNVYTKAQASAVLSDFFKKHPPGSSKTVHKLTSNPNHLFTVMVLSTTTGAYRTSFSLSNASGKFLITEISFELNKD
ncbi:MAG TPA: DUF4783 domain-containing protein [Sphingobacteriaceae bacterium]|nr:DUF4783 domain-containing protein [Sphingobacteriaceae bacterium]